MTVWLDVARVAAAFNLVLLAALGAVWLRTYREFRAQHTLGLLVFAGFLAVENGLWLYYYVLHPGFVDWYQYAASEVQVGMAFLCGLESLALVFLGYVTWK